MFILKNAKPGDRINVRYLALIQFAKVISNNASDRIITLEIVVGGCCGNIITKNKAYYYDSFDLKC